MVVYTLVSAVVPLDGLLRNTGQAPAPSGLSPFSMSVDKSDPMVPMDEASLRPAPRMIMKVSSGTHVSVLIP